MRKPGTRQNRYQKLNSSQFGRILPSYGCKFAVAGRGEKRLLKGVVAEEKSGSALCKYILATKAQENTTISLPDAFTLVRIYSHFRRILAFSRGCSSNLQRYSSNIRSRLGGGLDCSPHAAVDSSAPATFSRYGQFTLPWCIGPCPSKCRIVNCPCLPYPALYGVGFALAVGLNWR